MLHVHVLPVAPLGTGHMAQPGTDQHEGGVAVREAAYHAGTAADLPVEPFNDVIGTDAGPVFAGKIAVGMLGKPDNWDYTINGMRTFCTEGRDAIRSALKELEKFGYLERRKVRDSRGRYSDIEYIIYEEPISRSPCSAYPESENPSLDDPPSGNPPVINKEINKKRNNQELTQASIDSVPSGASREGSEDEGIWREIITENLESDIVREESGCDPGIVDNIVELMVETVCSTRRYIRVGKEDKPAAAVKSRLLKLERRHLEYVLWCMGKNTTEVRNIRAYLLTALYNSYFSESSGMAAQVQHDLYGKGGEAI